MLRERCRNESDDGCGAALRCCGRLRRVSDQSLYARRQSAPDRRRHKPDPAQHHRQRAAWTGAASMSAAETVAADRAASALFTPLQIRGITLPNRIVVSPMAQYAAVDGCATEWHFAHYAKFAMGGAGLVFTEATKVERRGLGTVGDMGIWRDEHVAPLRRITQFIKQQGAVPGMQLNHAGRKAGNARPWEGFGPLDRSKPVEGQAHWPVIGPS